MNREMTKTSCFTKGCNGEGTHDIVWFKAGNWRMVNIHMLVSLCDKCYDDIKKRGGIAK